MVSMAGSMTERSPGVWRLRVFLGRDPVTGRPIQSHETFRGTTRQAAKRLAKLVTDVEEGKVDCATATVGQLLDHWLANIEAERSPSTIRDYRGAIAHAIRPALGSIRLRRLAPDVLDSWYRRWATEEIRPATDDRPAKIRSATTVRKYHAILSAALAQGVKWGWLATNPAKRTSPPSASRLHMTVPTPAELQQIVHAAEKKDPVLGTAIALAALTGCRRGEVCGLRWSDVLPDALRIERSVAVVNGVVREGSTKTHQVRTIALDALAVSVLKARRKMVDRIAREAETAVVPDGFVLSHRADCATPVPPDSMTHGFAALMAKLKMPYHLHQLRHFAATTAIGAGVDIRTVAGRLGHADASTTLRIYAHVLQAQDRLAAEALGRALMPPKEVT